MLWWMKNHKSDKPSKVLIASLWEKLWPQIQGAKEEVPSSDIYIKFQTGLIYICGCRLGALKHEMSL